jgi:DNA repair protein RecN (Recombination protein N)
MAEPNARLAGRAEPPRVVRRLSAMLCFLRIRGLALLDDVSMELAPGLNVLTGETGAGKSIIVDAVSLLRGARARPEVIRAGDDQITVDAQFELPANVATPVNDLLDLHGVGTSQNELILQRIVPRAGRGRQFINAQLTTRAVLEEVGAWLVDICSQHEHQSLAQVPRHIELLDDFAGTESPLGTYSEQYAEYRQLLAERQKLVEQSRGAAERADYLRFQIDELERIAPQPGEFEQLKAQVTLMRDVQRWADFSRDALESLYEGEDSVSSRLGRLIDRARRGATDSPKLATLVDQLTTAQASCEDAFETVKRFASDIDLEPGALERAEERLNELTHMRRKHGMEPDDLVGRLQSMKQELELLSNVEQQLGDLDLKVDKAFAQCSKLAHRLREIRRKAAHQLSRTVQVELTALHIPHARFEAQIEALPPEHLTPRGLDRVEFVFSANPGEPLAPLARVASGGELSRVLLAIRGALAGQGAVSTYVFDEIDAGVGGAVAEAIGQRLALAARANQVLCITHLPQIAAYADAHFRVEKRAEAGRTLTRVQRLTSDERVEELARMLGGARIATSARAHARQLIEEAERARRPQGEVASATKRSKRA